MSLADRLETVRDRASEDHLAMPTLTTGPAPEDAAVLRRQDDALAGLKRDVTDKLFERLGSRIHDASLTDDQLRDFVHSELDALVDEEQSNLNVEEKRRIVRSIEDDALGLGPIQQLLDDESVSEIMVNRHDQIYVERGGRLVPSPRVFTSEDHLRSVIDRIVARVGRRIDESSPLVDARLLDGSRVNAVVPPLAVNGSSLTIRKFASRPFTVADLVALGAFSDDVADVLRVCVEGRLNILVSGGTGTGKTTLLNVLSSFIPDTERIVTVEDAVELQLQQRHVVRLESRPPSIEGTGEVTIRDLVRNSLRMRPDRIVIGECRGGEALDMLQAMNTGHDGSISTLHANSPRDALSRLETLVLMAGMDLPLRAIREQIASAVDLVVQITRMRDGSRRVTNVTEVHGLEAETVVLQDVFTFDHSPGIGPDGQVMGRLASTGLRPRFTERLEELGIAYPPHRTTLRTR